jgi:HAD superfamily hydrolase (TIGR01493 family)
VLFDLHSTLVDQGHADEWLDKALQQAPHSMTPEARAELVSFLDRIWENARIHDPDSLRDLSAAAHRDVFHRLLAEGPGVDPLLGDALYDQVTATWHAYEDAVPTLRTLKEHGIAIGILSNVGVDVRDVLSREGLLPYADAVVLSCDVGCVKPDAPIFEEALRALGLDANEVLMVGDSPKDDVGAAVLGIRTLILPRTRGPVHGLGVVAQLV